MYFSYIDESGDTKYFHDRYGGRPSEVFVLSSITINSIDWQDIERRIYNLRKTFDNMGILTVDKEFHTSNICNRHKPYSDITEEQVLFMLKRVARELASMDVKVISVVINKTIASPQYDIFWRAATYLTTRVDKYIQSKDNNEYFTMFCDKGYENEWVKVTRVIKEENYVKSFRSFKEPINNKIEKLVEDSIPRDSASSHLIQMADFIAFIVTQYYRLHVLDRKLKKRLSYINKEVILELMETLKPIFCKEAHYDNEYGIVIYPKSSL